MNTQTYDRAVAWLLNRGYITYPGVGVAIVVEKAGVKHRILNRDALVAFAEKEGWIDHQALEDAGQGTLL